MNAIVDQRSGALAAPQKNYFEQYAEAAETNRIVGDLLKFSKGEYLAGQHGDEIPKGTELIAHMGELMIGWIRWEDNKPTEMRMGRVAEGFVPPPRRELGDTDQNDWEIDPVGGQPRDPWQLTNYLVMKDPGSDKLYTFTTSSKGGLGAIAALCRAYGKVVRQRPDQFPIVALNVDSYKHSNKSFGKIFVPKLDVVGWCDKSEFDDALAADAAAREEEERDDIPFDEPVKKGGGKSKSAAPETAF